MIKRSFIGFGAVTFFILTSLIFAQVNQSTQQNKIYLSQNPPGLTPVLFAPEIFDNNQGYHSPVVFTSDFSEAVWSPMEQHKSIICSHYKDDNWTTPKKLDFKLTRGTGDATFWPDGSRIYFSTFNPPYPDAPEKERIWFAERTATGWSEPQLIDEVVLAHPTHWTFSFAANKNLYFTSEMPNVRGEQDIYMAVYDGEKYLAPVDLGEAINSDGKELAPFIARDESYLIFTRVGADTKKADLYISFKDNDRNWTKGKSMGDKINSDANDLCASVTPDGKYLFFISQKNGLMNKIYWVDASIIDSLR